MITLLEISCLMCQWKKFDTDQISVMQHKKTRKHTKNPTQTNLDAVL